jgi:hypothetical protein
MTRHSQTKLRWSHKPYRFRSRKTPYAPNETSHQGAYYETPLANPSSVSADGRRSTAVGSSLSVSDPMEPANRVDHLYQSAHLASSITGGDR